MDALKIGIVGTGRMGAAHAEKIRKMAGVQLHAVASRQLAHARAFAKKYEAPFFVESPEEIMNTGIDALVVASDGPSHESYVRACIEEGKPVFCEKPLSDTAQGCERLMCLEEQAGKRLIQVGFMRRFDAAHRKIRELIEGGLLGRALMLHAVHRNPEAPGFDERMEITDAAIHEIDVLPWLLGGDPLVSCVSFAGKSASAAPKGVSDPRFVVFETASGVIVDLEIFTNCAYGFDIKCDVVCEKGVVSLPQSVSPLVKTGGYRQEEEYLVWNMRYKDAFGTEMEHFIDGVHAGQISGPSVWDAYCAAVAAEACINAHRTGERQEIHYAARPKLYGE